MAASDLSVSQARRIVLAAQGFADPAPRGKVDRRHLRRVFGHIGLLQIDAVSVLVRAHYLPVYARLGPYPMQLLDRHAFAHREVFEYWGHEASLIPVQHQPLLRWRMERARTGEAWGGLVRLARERPKLVDAVRDEIAERGPVRAADLVDADARRRGGWWGWSDARRACEWLFWTGEVSVADRARGFDRVYDLTERVLPAEVLAAATPAEHDARRELLLLAARYMGLGAARDLADYFRLNIPKSRPVLAELVEDGRLVEVRVDGWREAAYLHPEARMPRRVGARALVSPFDPLVWERSRADRLFGFENLVLEFYTPATKRRFGYYVLPFLLGEELVARVDLKADRGADRGAGALLVQAAYLEPGQDAGVVAGELAEELRRMAGWLGLERVRAADRGDLAPTLRRSLRSG